MERADVVVIGAGVAGLAITRQLSLQGRAVLVLEAADTIGSGVSSRSSEVVHAGLYYGSDTLKAKCCVAGRMRLRDYCMERGIGFSQCGKLIVAETPDQIADLAKIRNQGERNGVLDLRMLSGAEARGLEPELRCAGALLSPSSGIVDSHQFMLALQGDAEAHGCQVVLRAPVAGGRIVEDGIILLAGQSQPIEIHAKLAINCAGLAAQSLALSIAGLDHARVPPLHLAKGTYFSLSGKAPFSRLVYPVPEAGGLGIHFTLDLAGTGRFGPDVEWIDSPDYDVDAGRARMFQQRIWRYWPGLDPGRLHPAYAGIRPKVARPGGAHTDFIIEGGKTQGCPSFISLFGIESPGLTASLALAEEVAKRVAAG